MRKVRTHKAFHLVQDATSSVPEKVFLVENSLKSFEYGLSSQLQMIGIIGPIAAIKGIIMSIDKELSGLKQQEKEQEVSYDIDLSLSQDEKAAIHLIELSSEDEESKHYCFAVLSAPDSFYHQKPFNPKSILYLLIRFLGDMCSTIVLAYDEPIEKDFQVTGCPYFKTKQTVRQMKMTARSVKDITFQQYPFDLRKLFDFQQSYYRNVNFNAPDRSNSLAHVNKVLASSYKDRFKEEINRATVICWEQIFQKSEKQADKVLGLLGRTVTKEGQLLVQQLIELESSLYRAVQKEADGILREVKSYYKRTLIERVTDAIYSRQSFCSRVYSLIVKQSVLQPKSQNYVINGYERLPMELTMAIAFEIDGEYRKKYEFYQEMFAPPVFRLIKQVTCYLSNVVQEVYREVQKTFNQELVIGEELIEVSVFGLQIIRERLGRVVEGIALMTSSISFKETICKEKLGIEKLQYIRDIRVFDLRGKRQAKLVWIELIGKQSASAVLLTSCGEEKRLLRKFIPPNIQFFFSSENQKGYVLNASQSQLTHFKIDELERIMDEKAINYSKDPREVISFGVSIYPERLFYLTKDRNVLYSYSLFDKSGEQQICHTMQTQGKPIKYLRLREEKPYDYVKCFNEDIYTVLGNDQLIHIIEPNKANKPVIKMSIELKATFFGINIFADNVNEYLVVHDQNNPQLWVLANMSAKNILEQQAHQQEEKKGNPIMDVFIEAYGRFGDYTQEDLTKKLSLVHVTNLEEKRIMTYVEQLCLSDHDHFVLASKNAPELLKRSLSIPASLLLQVIHTRIPIQICTIQEGNLEPLCGGKREQFIANKALSVAQRSRMLNFGVIEEFMGKQRDKDKRVLVVSVMGAQSTGKSYLMNRLFGTRFTVASSRTTDGLWISLTETKNVNFLLIDCQGLFSTDRSPKQEEKLIRVLASLSDYTIMNQNMGMNSRNISELMHNIATSAYSSDKDAQSLYKGQLFIVVRDVPTSESDAIVEEFQRNFSITQKKEQGNAFILKLFGGNINIFTVNNFESKDKFKWDIKSIRGHFETEGMKRPFRNAQEVLEKLKIVMTQLVCDDTEKFDENLEKYKFEAVREDIMNLWKRGSNENKRITGEIGGKQMSLLESEVVLVSEGDKAVEVDELQAFINQFKLVVTSQKLSTTEFNSIYRALNDFIVKFFDHRRKLVEDLIAQRVEKELKNIEDEKKKAFLLKLRNSIAQHASTLKLCLSNCYECKLLCVSRSDHRSNIEQEKQNTRIKICEAQASLKALQLTQRESELKREGVGKKETEYEDEMQLLQRDLGLLDEHERNTENINLQKEALRSSETQIKSLAESVSKKSLDKLKTEVEKVSDNIKQFNATVDNNKSNSELASIDPKIIVESKDIKDCKTRQETQEEKEAMVTAFGRLNSSLSEIQKKLQSMITRILSAKEQEGRKKEAAEIYLGKIEAEYKGKTQLINQKQSELSLAERRLSDETQSLEDLEKKSGEMVEQLKGIERDLERIRKEKLETTKVSEEIGEVQQLHREIQKLRQELKQERFDPNLDGIIRKRLAEIVAAEKKLRCLKPSKERIERLKRFEEYEANLKLKLEESAPKKGSKESPKKQYEDCRQALKAKVQNWTRKSQKNPENEKFKKNKEEFEKMLEEYNREASLAGKNQQSENEAAIKEAKGQLFSSLVGNFGKEVAQILEAIAKYSSHSTFGMVPDLLGSFLAANPAYVIYKNDLTGLLPNNEHDLKTSLRDKQTERDNLKLECDETEDVEIEAKLEAQIDQFDNEIKLMKAKLQFATFQYNNENRKASASQQSPFGRSKEEVAKELSISPIPTKLLSQERLQDKIKELNDQIAQLREEVDEIEEESREIELEQEIGKLKRQCEGLESEIKFVVKLTEKVEEITKQKLVAFLEQNPKYNGRSLKEITIVVDVENEKVTLKGNSITEGDINQDFCGLTESKENALSFKEQPRPVDPLYKAIVHKYPNNYATIVEALQEFLNNLNIPSNLLSKSLISLTEQSIATGKPETLQEDILRFVINELSATTKEQQSRLDDQIRHNLSCEQRAKKCLKDSQELNKAEHTAQERQRTTKKNLEKARSSISKMLGQVSQTTQKLTLLRQEIGTLSEAVHQLTAKAESFRAQIKISESSLKSLEHEEELNKKLCSLIVVNPKQQETFIESWSTEQLKNIEVRAAIEEAKEKIETLSRAVDNLQTTNKEIETKLAGKTLNSLNKEIENVKALQLELSNLQEKLKKIEDIKGSMVLLNQKKESLDKKAGQLCSCFTNHICDQPCEAGCEGKKCHKAAGHTGGHLCKDQDHSCQSTCEREEKCKNKCTEKFGHSPDMKHDCHNEHRCMEKCKYCDKTCCKPQYDNHELHACDNNQRCMFVCILCEKPCASNHHNHDEEIEIVDIKNRKKEKKENEQIVPEVLRRKMHLCANEHPCVDECSEQGVCVYTYGRINKTWKRQESEQPYIYMEQISNREKCVVQIPVGAIQHEGKCTCKRVHSCTSRCPDCKSLCELGMNHAETKHKTQHRNQESLIYVAEQENAVIRVEGSDGKDFIFNAGEEATPSTCYEGCKRKGRGHFHLMECKGGDQCGEIKYKGRNKVRHSPKIYYPNEKKRYDIFLCAEYWDAWNFQMPNPHSIEQYSSCNFACKMGHDGDEKKHLFCKQLAWHSFQRTREAHEFECDKEHKSTDGKSAESLEICFLIDVTGSMKRWVDECKKTISMIIQKTSQKYPKLPLKFSVVGYRDHPMRHSKMVHELKKVAQLKLQEITKNGFSSPHMLITLSEEDYIRTLIKLQSQWESKRSNMDAFKKGLTEAAKFIFKYHYPFIFDIDTKEDIVSVHQKMKLANPLKLLLALMSGGKVSIQSQERPLSIHLVNDIKQSIKDLDEHINHKEDQLLARLDFTTGADAIKFLDSPAMESTGGGDPSEAVLDGMNEVATLKWSKGNGSLKYVFHLFDAPPHGRAYRDGDDFFPDGCPCGLKEEVVIKRLNDIQVKYIVFPLTPHVNKAMELFKAGGLKMESQKIEEPEEITVKSIGILVEQLEQKDVSVTV